MYTDMCPADTTYMPYDITRREAVAGVVGTIDGYIATVPAKIAHRDSGTMPGSYWMAAPVTPSGPASPAGADMENIEAIGSMWLYLTAGPIVESIEVPGRSKY